MPESTSVCEIHKKAVLAFPKKKQLHAIRKSPGAKKSELKTSGTSCPTRRLKTSDTPLTSKGQAENKNRCKTKTHKELTVHFDVPEEGRPTEPDKSAQSGVKDHKYKRTTKKEDDGKRNIHKERQTRGLLFCSKQSPEAFDINKNKNKNDTKADTSGVSNIRVTEKTAVEAVNVSKNAIQEGLEKIDEHHNEAHKSLDNNERGGEDGEEGDEETEGEEEEGKDEDPPYDYDEDFEEPETFDISKFDFEHLTKSEEDELTFNQQDYKRYCKFTKIPPRAYVLRSLATTRITLNCQQLGPQGIKALSFALCNNCTVTDLEISEDEIDQDSMVHLCDMYYENQFLTRLDFSNNRMGRLPVKMLLEALQEVDRVTFLNLSGNKLEDMDGDIFVDYLGDTQFLKELDLSYNNFRDEAPQVIGKCLMRNSSIESLSLRWNQMHMKGATSFLACMEKNSSITFLDLAWNGLGEEGVKSLCKMLKKNSVIEVLDISSNKINLESVQALMAVIKKSAAALRSLKLGENIISSRDIHVLLKDLLDCKGDFGLKDISFGNQTIDLSTLPLVESLMDEKDVVVTHGAIFGLKQKTYSDEDALANLNPVTVLLEFARLVNMTLMELFEYLDDDGSQTLSRDEIKNGLLEFEIPLPERSLDILIRKMDSDGDGEISVADLMGASGQAGRAKEKVIGGHTGGVDPIKEITRCRKILKRLLSKHHEKTQESFSKAAEDGEAGPPAPTEEVPDKEEADKEDSDNEDSDEA